MSVAVASAGLGSSSQSAGGSARRAAMSPDATNGDRGSKSHSSSKSERKEARQRDAAARSSGDDSDASSAANGSSKSSSSSSSSSKKHKKDRASREGKHSKKDGSSRHQAGDGDYSSGDDIQKGTLGAHASHATDTAARQKVTGPARSAFRYVYPIIDVPIPPALNQDAHRAAEELMDTLLMRYVPQLGGVLLSHSNITFPRRHASFEADGAFSTVPATVTCLLWAPEVGMRLEGQLKLSTPSHVSLLVHGIFNASVTAAHLPSSLEAPHAPSGETAYDWQEYHADGGDGAADEEPMEGVEGAGEEAAAHEPGAVDQDASASLADDYVEKSTGFWKSRKTGSKLGGDFESSDGRIIFTVVGMTIANHMLSIHGSLLRRPFAVAAPTHVPTLVKTLPLEAAASETARRVRFRDENQTSEFHPYEEDDCSRASDEDDDADADDDDAVAAITRARASVDMRSTARVKSASSTSSSSKKRIKKAGPRQDGEVTTSESEAEGASGTARREKKKRKKEA